MQQLGHGIDVATGGGQYQRCRAVLKENRPRLQNSAPAIQLDAKLSRRWMYAGVHFLIDLPALRFALNVLSPSANAISTAMYSRDTEKVIIWKDVF